MPEMARFGVINLAHIFSAQKEKRIKSNIPNSAYEIGG